MLAKFEAPEHLLSLQEMRPKMGLEPLWQENCPYHHDACQKSLDIIIYAVKANIFLFLLDEGVVSSSCHARGEDFVTPGVHA